MKIGIDCENIQDDARWGISQIILNIAYGYTESFDLQRDHKLYLYFKDSIPNDPVFQNEAFEKRVVKLPFIKRTPFNIYYHILMPIRAMFDRLDMMFFPPYMLPPLYFFKSIVLLTPDAYHEARNGTLPFRYRLAYTLFSNWAAMMATKILAISETSKKELTKLFKIKHTDRIGVALLGFDKKTSGTWKMNIDLNFPYILYVGQMFPRRRARESIEAFAEIAPEFPDLKFVLVGRDKYPTPTIQNLVDDVNSRLGSQRVIYYDYIDKDEDLMELYRGAYLFVYISTSEAFGLPPVEAACQGIPVVVKDNELNHELFGDAAFFVENEYNPSVIAYALKKGLTDQEHRAHCVEKYKEIPARLNWANFTNKFFEIVSN